MVTTGISTASFFDTLMLEDAPALFRKWGEGAAEHRRENRECGVLSEQLLRV